MRIVSGHTADQVPRVQRLFKEYAVEIGEDLCFQGFAEELANLPGKYAPPDGRLFLAESEGEYVACVGLRRLDSSCGELKRLYVRPKARGCGVGRLLTETAISAARDVGYKSLRLDTLVRMKSAVSLYESLGFIMISAYYENPLPDVSYYQLDLA